MRRKSEEDEKVIWGDKIYRFAASLLMVQNFQKKIPAAMSVIENTSFELTSCLWCIFPLRLSHKHITFDTLRWTPCSLGDTESWEHQITIFTSQLTIQASTVENYCRNRRGWPSEILYILFLILQYTINTINILYSPPSCIISYPNVRYATVPRQHIICCFLMAAGSYTDFLPTHSLLPAGHRPASCATCSSDKPGWRNQGFTQYGHHNHIIIDNIPRL